MRIIIDNRSNVPIYSQIQEQIKHLAAIQDLKNGEKMPTIRELAVELSINPNTVAKAYLELQREGILETKQGIGTYVTENKDILKPDERENKLLEIIHRFSDDASRFGFSKKEIINALIKISTSLDNKK